MSPPGIHYRFEAIGTHWVIDIDQADEPLDETILKQAIFDRIEQFDKDYSRFRDDSLVTQMSQEAGNYALPDDARALVDLYKKLYDVSGGNVTPLIGQTLSDAGYDKDYLLQPGSLSQPPSWDTALEYNWPVLTIKQPALLDFGAAGKGYLVDIIAELLLDRGAVSFCINAGGDIVCRTADTVPTEIALEHPSDPTLAIGVANITNQSLCGSAGNRRAWGRADQRYHHIISPKTLQSPRHIAAVWAVAETGLLADAMTTALFFVTPDILLEQFRFAYAIVNADNSLQHSDNFPGSFYTT